MKNMGDAAGVPIEPDEQTGLLDRCWKIPGVIGGGVPGGEHVCLHLFCLFDLRLINSCAFQLVVSMHYICLL